MSVTATVPDVEVDESELMAQPCRVVWRRRIDNKISRRCRKPAVGETLIACSGGCAKAAPHCAEHLGDPKRTWSVCPKCGQPCWVVVSRYYTTN